MGPPRNRGAPPIGCHACAYERGDRTIFCGVAIVSAAFSPMMLAALLQWAPAPRSQIAFSGIHLTAACINYPTGF
jgi:hypothetical protein